MSIPRTSHQDVVVRILRYLKCASGRELLYLDCGYNRIASFSYADWTGCPINRSTTWYCVFVGGNLVSRKVRSMRLSLDQVQSQYIVMVGLTCERVWIHDTLIEIGFIPKILMRLLWQLVGYLQCPKSCVWLEEKHIEIDCHVARKNYDVGIIGPKHVSYTHQLADLLTNPLGRSWMQFICNKLGTYDIYAPAWRGALCNKAM